MIPLRELFEVIDIEHDRPGHALTGSYRNIAGVKQRLRPAILAALPFVLQRCPQ